jgi:hypothetical protein
MTWPFFTPRLLCRPNRKKVACVSPILGVLKEQLAKPFLLLDP